MATQAEIDEVRRAAGLITDDPPYTDEYISALFDAKGFNVAVASIWRERAATYAGMVDTTESGSSRRMSQLHDHALKMAVYYENSEVAISGGRSFTVAIERS